MPFKLKPLKIRQVYSKNQTSSSSPAQLQPPSPEPLSKLPTTDRHKPPSSARPCFAAAACRGFLFFSFLLANWKYETVIKMKITYSFLSIHYKLKLYSLSSVKYFVFISV